MRESRILSAVLSVAMLVSVVPVFAAQSTVDGHWSNTSIGWAIEQGYVQGDENGNVDPEETLSRAQFTTIAVREQGLEAEGENIFVDVEAGAWYEEPIVAAYENGIVTGYPDNYFKPLDPVTRTEAIAILARAWGVEADEDVELPFNDLSSIEEWALPYVKAFYAGNIVRGDGKNFNPNDPITYGEMSQIVYNNTNGGYTEEPVEDPDATPAPTDKPTTGGGGGGGGSGVETKYLKIAPVIIPAKYDVEFTNECTSNGTLQLTIGANIAGGGISVATSGVSMTSPGVFQVAVDLASGTQSSAALVATAVYNVLDADETFKQYYTPAVSSATLTLTAVSSGVGDEIECSIDPSTTGVTNNSGVSTPANAENDAWTIDLGGKLDAGNIVSVSAVSDTGTQISKSYIFGQTVGFTGSSIGDQATFLAALLGTDLSDFSISATDSVITFDADGGSEYLKSFSVRKAELPASIVGNASAAGWENLDATKVYKVEKLTNGKYVFEGYTKGDGSLTTDTNEVGGYASITSLTAGEAYKVTKISDAEALKWIVEGVFANDGVEMLSATHASVEIGDAVVGASGKTATVTISGTLASADNTVSDTLKGVFGGDLFEGSGTNAPNCEPKNYTIAGVKLYDVLVALGYDAETDLTIVQTNAALGLYDDDIAFPNGVKTRAGYNMADPGNTGLKDSTNYFAFLLQEGENVKIEVKKESATLFTLNIVSALTIETE